MNNTQFKSSLKSSHPKAHSEDGSPDSKTLWIYGRQDHKWHYDIDGVSYDGQKIYVAGSTPLQRGRYEHENDEKKPRWGKRGF